MFQPRGNNLWSQILYGSKIYPFNRVFKASLSFLPYLILYLFPYLYAAHLKTVLF